MIIDIKSKLEHSTYGTHTFYHTRMYNIEDFTAVTLVLTLLSLSVSLKKTDTCIKAVEFNDNSLLT